jgi:hypothetical protein
VHLAAALAVATACARTARADAFWTGGRYHVSEHVALVLRIGYPTFSFGVSFM